MKMHCHPCCWCRNPDSEESEELLLDSVDSHKHYSESDSQILEDAQTISKHRRKYLIGCGIMILGVLECTFGMAFCQLLNRLVPHSELNGLRFSFQLFVSIIAASFRKCDVKIEKKKIGWTVLVSLSLILSSYCNYGSAYYLPVGIISGVGRSSNLVLFYIVSFLIVRVSKWEHLIAGLICLFGVLLVFQPSFIFHHQPASFIHKSTGFRSPCNRLDNETTSSVLANTSSLSESMNSTMIAEEGKTKDHIIGYTLICGYVFASATTVFVTKYKLSDVDSMVFIFWCSLIGVIISFVLMGITENPVFPAKKICSVFLVMHMLLAGTYNCFFVYSYQTLPPTMCALLATLQIPISFVLQYTFLSGMYPGHANTLEISGAVLVFVGNLLVPVYESVQYFKLRNN